MNIPKTTQEQQFTLLAELTQEQDSFFRGTPRASYFIDGEEVDRDGWRAIMTDRYNQLALACQMEGQAVELEVPPGSCG